MYTLKKIEIEGLQCIELANFDNTSIANICLNQGGRLNNFVYENTQILAEYPLLTYTDNYASSILFPFANRIKDGEYIYNDSKYKLDCNDVDKNNAIHGLVYNKTFSCTEKAINDSFVSVTLQHKDNGESVGFPFKFKIELTYTLSKVGLNLSVVVVNEDEKTFPFTLGWHPYFISDNLDNSTINFKSQTKYVFDHQQILSGSKRFDSVMPFQLKDVKLDDCFPLEIDKIQFSTPKYKLDITTSSKENFLQLYTPDQPNVIAIEPMTGAPDNFNNRIGLQKLHPNETYNVEWNLTIETLNPKKN